MSPDSTPSPDRIDAGRQVEPKTPTRSEPGSEFRSFMEQSGASAPGVSQTGPTSPLQMAAANMPNASPTFDTLMTQSRNVQDSLGNLKNQLKTPNLTLKRSQAHLLKNKLGDANDYMRGAANKLGIDTPPMKTPKQPGATEKLMAYINDGQEKMVSIQQKLDDMMSSGTELKPADMMLVQIKMGQAQQELEYSSTVLSKVVDALKQLFNIQL